ncbi:hypothetical protein GGX14DRAFT_391801 [Mycena pura]|uniref:Uncharacterized protein n=1 Tax=Mycena pura TaxID=153505 RepID=A0AAD6YI41_9AGAR|nr:hypothetical protein GGX14DRAFT_391801 [Mycena pura]
MSVERRTTHRRRTGRAIAEGAGCQIRVKVAEDVNDSEVEAIADSEEWACRGWAAARRRRPETRSIHRCAAKDPSAAQTKVDTGLKRSTALVQDFPFCEYKLDRSARKSQLLGPRGCGAQARGMDSEVNQGLTLRGPNDFNGGNMKLFQPSTDRICRNHYGTCQDAHVQICISNAAWGWLDSGKPHTAAKLRAGKEVETFQPLFSFPLSWGSLPNLYVDDVVDPIV